MDDMGLSENQTSYPAQNIHPSQDSQASSKDPTCNQNLTPNHGNLPAMDSQPSNKEHNYTPHLADSEKSDDAKSGTQREFGENNPIKETSQGSRDNDLTRILQGSLQGSRLSTQSQVNPLTPRYTAMTPSMTLSQAEIIIEHQEPNSGEDEVIHLNTNHWIPRIQISTSSVISSKSERDSSDMEEDFLDNEIESLQQELYTGFHNLRVKSKRGRPHKFNPKITNKHFKVPKKKKSRGEGLQQITHFFLNNSHDEVESIYENGMLMGLLPLHSKDKSIDLIKRNLRV
ncbi:hypothetical protein DCAR_0519577 [Daucus carota subsp. sativus]|uniref:Uncharacterized protein n=1 Tax=Daucus carota subsp. sativus TaxID=79200 RepID=A0A162A1X2_DAUCS|nr:hypothetical protein DCAR_0519577 [Daucus carota subsp. sativus]